MAEIVRMPKMSDTMTEGVVAKWHKKVGDKIKSGDLVAEIETDKATMEFESYQEGILLYRGIEEGKKAPVDGILAILGKEGEDFKPLLEAEKAKQQAVVEVKAEAQPAAKTQVAAPSQPAIPAVPSVEKKRDAALQAAAGNQNLPSGLKVSPLAKKLAGDKGVDLSKVMGSGEQGRIVKRDIDWYKPGMVVNGSIFNNAVKEEGYDRLKFPR
jgi:pyruvate dehydrogenase E2 component (dihydrolipoamide acetyltransferase)